MFIEINCIGEGTTIQKENLKGKGMTILLNMDNVVDITEPAPLVGAFSGREVGEKVSTIKTLNNRILYIKEEDFKEIWRKIWVLAQ